MGSSKPTFPRVSGSEEPLYEGSVNFVKEYHIEAFAAALAWEDHQEDETTHDTATTNGFNLSTSSLQSPTSDLQSHHTPVPHGERDHLHRSDIFDPSIVTMSPAKPDLITSKSDWYPINQTSPVPPRAKSKRKVRKTSIGSNSTSSSSAARKTFQSIRNEFRSSITYTLLRWPLLFLVLLWIGFLCNCYVVVRAYVALSEYFLTWRGERRKIRDRLRSAKNYEEWVKTAKELDSFLNLDKWSSNPKFSYYDYRTVKLTTRRLEELRTNNEDDNLIIVLQGCLKKNFAGIENRQLYSHRYYGTKKLVDKYIEEVCKCIQHVTNSTNINLPTKRKFFKYVSKNYGKTALCLSGGACFAYTHFGIVKALLDNDLLPSIISGTSGGGIVAALACTRTDAELRKLLVPKLATKITACEDPWWVWIPRWWKTGARFDSIEWARKACFFTRGSSTFLESFQRTGRKLNISTVPADPHSPVILCNSMTSPNCIIWSSLLASSAVPGILNPVVLMMKNPHNNEVVPFSLGNKWRDGSLRTDIPLDALNTYYNVNFSIVSQVNPHISLFFYAPKGTVGRPVAISRRVTKKEKYASLRGGFVATALEQLFKLEIRKWLQMIKTLDLLPNLLESDWSNIWLQRFSGTITIWPKIKLKDFWYILSDPTEEQLEEMILKGERCMFPSLLFISHRLSIERELEKGRNLCRAQQKKLQANAQQQHQQIQQSSQQKQSLPSTLNQFEISSTTSRGTDQVYNDSQFGVQMYTVDGDDEDNEEDTDSSEDELIGNEAAQFNLGASYNYSDEEEDDEDYLPSEEVDGDEEEEVDSSTNDSDEDSEDSIETGGSDFFSLFRRSSVGSNKLTRRNTIY
ncbi:patatin-like phospholipase domain-containing protein [[Candida] railenensis]|uniref:Patatin-like phospholipase domain-containing protein n=1 Tax=[Candida] railenensis TaxID=45579 RepID=A0A9P0VWB9_9ASCO|nr:patatin-like phospholipase domain-containing protein [[Candida] railenensis]